jgi:outer membrane protein assembly factor BamD (BamD/ComL family)
VKNAIRLLATGALLIAFVSTIRAQTPDPREDTLSKLLERGRKAPEALTSDEVVQLLQLGRDLGQPCSVAPPLKAYLARNVNVALPLLRLAAENARLCGDFRASVSRYKQYLKSAAATPEASDDAAHLYQILVDYLGAGDDAFQFMTEYGEKLRQTPRARRYDVWYLAAAQERRAFAAMANRLALIMSDGLPLEQERLFFWPYLDARMFELSHAGPDRYDAVASARRVVSLIRENPWRQARFNFYVAHLAFMAGATGKEPAVLNQEFEAVAAAARAYLDADPRAATLQDIMTVFTGGQNRPSDQVWNLQTPQKCDVFKYAFPKLAGDPERATIIGWQGWWSMHTRMAAPAQWVEFGKQYPELFRRTWATSGLPFVPVCSNTAQYRAQAAFLQGVQGKQAAVINAMASSDDIWACVQNLMQQQSWCLPFQDPADRWDINHMVCNWMLPAYASFPRDDAHKLPPLFIEKTQLRFAATYLFRTPLALVLPDAVRDNMRHMWSYSGVDANDKSKIAEHLHMVDWVPYTTEQRSAIFAPTYDEFKRWADEGRRAFEAARKAKDAAAAALDAAQKARADTTRLQEEKQKGLAEARAAQPQAIAALQATQKAQADATKARTDALAALNAAQAAKDTNKVAALTKQIADLTQTVTESGQRLTRQEKAVEELNARIGGLENSLKAAAETAKQQDAPMPEVVKNAQGTADALKALEARVALIVPLEEAFKQVMSVQVTDISKAPDATCQNMAKAVLAAQKKNLEEYVAAAKAVYPGVRDYYSKKTPLGYAILRWLVQNRLNLFDTFDWQSEVLADQLALWAQQGDMTGVYLTLSAIPESRPGWGWLSVPDDQKDKKSKLNAILGQATLDSISRNQFSDALFNWFRGVRMDNQMTRDVIGKFIEQKICHSKPTLRYGASSATCSYMWLIQSDFPWGNEKYPVQSYFDDMYAAEIRQSRLVDPLFWNWSQDLQRKGANAAAAVLQDVAKLPFGYSSSGPFHSPPDFWRVMNCALQADEAPRSAMLAKVEAAYGTTRFDEYAMGRYSLAYFPVDRPDGRKQYFEKLAVFLDRAAAVPAPVAFPVLPSQFNLGKASDLTDTELTLLVRAATQCYWPWSPVHPQPLIGYLHEGLLAKKRGRDLFPLIPIFWKMCPVQDMTTLPRTLAQYAAALADSGQTDLAAAYSTIGHDLLGSGLPEDARNTLLAVRSKSLTAIGAVIPVERSDRRYPIFAAQAAYLAGKYDNAWELHTSQRNLALTEFKNLDLAFTTWLIEKHTELGQFDDANNLAQKLIEWVDSAPQGFDVEARAHLLVAYADISFARQEYPKAKAQYERIAVAKEFDGTIAKKTAELKIAEVDRVTRRYDAAVEQLENLSRRRDAYLQTEANYRLALVKFDQEEYAAARECLNQVFALEPNHPNARILEGRLYLKMKKLVEATDLHVGRLSSQKTILPGRPLKVQIEDRNLAIVGKSADIEVKVWTDSGDEEYFNLLPFGDSKTKFEGQIPTALAAAQKGDHVLQVLGGDKVHYDFSERFRQAGKITEAAPPDIAVISDAELMVSSGKILTREEQEARALENLIRQRSDMADVENTVMLSTYRADDEVKPGNSINVRIVDPDRSTTTGRDKIRIRVSTSSGDSIDAFPLEETDGYSGVFEGKIPTASGSATAFASDSEEGKLPVHVISKGDYPPWVGLTDNRRPKTFTVDLNDNVMLGRMNIVADVPGRKLRRFLLQTSMNGRDFTSVAGWPLPVPGWDGALCMTLARFGDVDGEARSLDEFRHYLATGFMLKNTPITVIPLKATAMSIDGSVMGNADALGLAWNGPGSRFIGCVRGAFYLPERQVRTFRVDHKNRLQSISYVLTVDGERGKDPYEVSRSLSRGAHELALFVCAYRHAGPSFDILCDIPDPPYMARCPTNMFDLSGHPELAALRFEPARISPGEATNSFDVAFGTNRSARMVRLYLADFETDAPALRKISLTGADGQTVLPPREDLSALQQNQVLEIVPGDRISIVYDDPDFLTKEKRVLEAFMKATFYNATISACFVESVLDANGNRVPRYVPMQRFKVGDAINVFINEPDADVSDAPDRLPFSARTAQGKPVQLEALETAAHSGVFIGKVFPVAGDPQRPSEVRVGSGDDVILAYLDEKNTDCGVPWSRTYTVEQSVEGAPQVRVYDVVSRALTTNEIQSVEPKGAVRRFEEYVPPTRTITAIRPAEFYSDRPATGMIACPLIVEVTYPMIAQSPLSKATLYVQALSGRKAATPNTAPEEFDTSVPGTLKLEVNPGDPGTVSPPPGYRDVFIRGNPHAGNALEDGRFTFVIPMQLGQTPTTSLISETATESDRGAADEYDPSRFTISIRVPYVDTRQNIYWSEQRIRVPKLTVSGNDEVFIGFPIVASAEGSNTTRWVTRRVVLKDDAFFDAMDRRYEEPLESLHVGESAYFRVINPAGDLSNDKDEIEIKLAAGTNTTRSLRLMESFPHSGIFKGVTQLAFSGDPARAGEPGIFPVGYGESFTATYEPPGGAPPLSRVLRTFKGANGAALPFTKRFKDPDIAVQTQFTVAEAYFEMAKKHRALGQDVLSRREIAQGKKLLEEAIRDYPATEARAQADYLLADLSFEAGNDAADGETRKKHYVEAVTRFSDIVASYPDSPYAPKAQYKKALVFEKLGQIDQACEEYVKLSYRYPDNELVAETIARLGQYFLTKGREIQDTANAESDPVKKERGRLQAIEMYRTAGQVFGRLASRFPDHQLAGKTTVLSAQCYMRAEDMDKAIDIFKQIVAERKADTELIAQSMYWCGDCYMKKHDYVNAYRQFKKLTWDYPESTWAKYARGRLSESDLARVEVSDMQGGN